MNERDLLRDCLRRLNRLGIDYLLTGSMASNSWGIPHTTNDVDFVVQFPPETAAQVVSAFDDPYSIQEPSVRATFQPPYRFNVIDLVSGLKIDFRLLTPHAFDQEMFRRRQRQDLFREPAWIATAKDVILHKLYWSSITPSERQVGDAAGVVAVPGDALDRDYLLDWAKQLGLTEMLQDLLTGKIRPNKT